MNIKQVVHIFTEAGLLDHGQAEDIQAEVNHSGKTPSEVMVDYGICTEEQFYQTIAEALGVEFVSLAGFEPPTEVLRLIPAGLAVLHKALPIGIEGGNTVQIALADPLNPQTVEDLRFSLDRDIQVVVAPVHQIEELIKKNYGTDMGSMEEILAQLGGDLEFGGGVGNAFDLKSLEAEANATPIIRYVDLILYQAIQDRASDIHFEPFESEFK